MEDKYKKSKGNAGLEGVQFQLNLLTVFLLNALHGRKNWKISTENQEAGKYDDLVLDLPNKSVLLQAKFKQNKKITKDQLFSCNSKNADFSLPKYFFSYLEIKSVSIEKSVIICSNTNIDEKGLETFMTCHNVSSDSMLHYEGDTCQFLTFNDNILADLKTSVEIYLHKNLQGKGFDIAVITDENIRDFLNHLQIYSNYPSGGKLDQIIGKLLSRLNSSSLFQKVSSQDIYKKIEDWFKQPRGEYLTEIRAKAMFCEIKSDKYCQKLQNYNVSFRDNDFNFMKPISFFQTASEGGHLLHALKIYDAVQKDERKKLYVNPDEDVDVQERVIEAFELPRYTFLIIIGLKISKETVIKEIMSKVGDLLKKFTYKKVILVSHNDKLYQQIGSNDVFDVNGSVTFKNLADECQKRLVQEQIINFQGNQISLEDLLTTQMSEDWAKAVNSEILEKLIRKKEIKVGTRHLNLNELNSRCYVYRTFKRQICKGEDVEEGSDELKDSTLNSEREGSNQNRDETFPEENIYGVNEDVVLIADSAGMGKSTVLTKLSTTIKEKYPLLWVIKIELTEYTGVLMDLLRDSAESVSPIKLLDSRKETKLTNHLEKFIFSINKKVVLMLDGIDEISPDYTGLVLSLLTKCRTETNFAKLFVTTRPHMIPELKKVLKVNPFILEPFTEQNQVNFLANYWTHNLDIESENKGKCELYARALINRMSSWTKDYYYKEHDFTAVPLHLGMVAEIFQESIQGNGSSVWEGCKEYLNETTIEPKLPEMIEIKKLYDMFIEKKRDIYMNKGNPSGNSAANKALIGQFNESLIYHRKLALEVILHREDCQVFSFYEKGCDDIDESMLKIGIVQGTKDKLHFIHRTFAEYFVAESLVDELQFQLRSPNVKFQEFFIDSVLQFSEYKIIRTFLDNFLQKIIDLLPSNIFQNYQSCIQYPNYWTHDVNLIHLLAEEGCKAILQLVLKCIDFKIISDKEINIVDLANHIPSKKKHMFKYLSRKTEPKMNSTGNVLKAIQILTREGGINIQDKFGRTPLHYAATSGHFEVVKFLVAQGAKVDSIDRNGYTALNLAAAIGRADIVEYLVDFGADVAIRNNSGRATLHFAAQSTKLDTVKHLIKSGSDTNIEDYSGRRALHFAAAGDQLAIVEYLVKSSEDVNVYDNNGRTALHFAAAKAQLAVVEHLVKFTVNINFKDHSGRTALHFAAAEGKLDNVEYLLKRSSNVNVQDKIGRAPLHFAVAWGHLPLVGHLIKCGGDVNLRDNHGNTALHLAAKKGELDSVKFLLGYDADLNIEDYRGHTPMQSAADCGHLDIVNFLKDYGSDTTTSDD